MSHSLFRIIPLVSLLSLPLFQAEAEAPAPLPTLGASKTLFEEASQAARTRYQEQRDLVLLQYANELNAVRRDAQEEGDLDGVLQVQREQERARAGEPPGEVNPDTVVPPGLRTARERAMEQLARLAEREQREIRQLQAQYLAFLQRMEREHTIQNNIPEALAFREERQRVEAGLPPEAVSPPAGHQEEDVERVTLAWHRGMAGRQAELRRGNRVENIGFEHGGDNRQGARGLSLQGGVSRLPGMGEILGEAFRATHQFTLVATFEPARVPQSGPARILSFSRDHGAGNFTLGQDNDQLVLRLRTSNHGGTGVPNLPLGPVRAGRSTRVVITYEPGSTRLFRDGREVELPERQGDFSNWEAFEFVMGDEHVGGRPWHGLLHDFTLANQALPREAALRLSRTR